MQDNPTHIIVASTNPVKIESAREAFAQVFNTNVSVSGASVDSGVSDQPMSDDETYQGALNRAKAARETHPDAMFWIGIEGGVQQDGRGLSAFAWAIVLDPEGKTGAGKSATFYLPPRVAALVRDGKELGDADDMVFGTQKSKHDTGSIGLLTDDVITRTSLYVPAVVIALINHRKPDLYP